MKLESPEIIAVAKVLRRTLNSVQAKPWMALLTPEEVAELKQITEMVEREVDNLNH